MSNDNEEMPASPGNLFARTLADIAHGDLQDQASDMLRQLACAVRETAKTGSITITLTVKPRGRDCGQVEVSGTCALKSPVPDIAPSMLFVSEDGTFHRDNPAQLKMSFADMPKALPKAASNQ
jgi:hypothetical protein